ncbi:MAG: carboxypeptidase regulatory-like domain-containing protein [Bryobacteraceae bacterium]|nr:carboxypeptidase regulatory-like domain-containing protein [Bryobacteraceae bacterium]
MTSSLVAARAVVALIGVASSLVAGAVNGVIVEHHTGSPVRAAAVHLFKGGEPAAVVDVETDGEGRFEAPGLPAGEYRIEAGKANYADAALHVRVGEGDASVTRPLIRLARLAVITGRVNDLGGKPVRRAMVVAMRRSARDETALRFALSAPGASAPVDERGQYRLHGLLPGQYAVAVSHGPSGGTAGGEGIGPGVLFYPENARPRFFVVFGGEEYEGVDFIIRPARLYSVSGRVELPAPGARFSLALTPADQPAIALAITGADADGNFRFDRVPAGAYHLFASGPAAATGGRGAVLGSEPLFGRRRVEVIDQNAVDISVPVQTGRSAAFVLRHTPPRGKSCPQTARLALSPVEDWGAHLERTATIGLDKAATIIHLPPARYSLRVSQLGTSCYSAGSSVVDLTETADGDPIAVEVAPAGSIRGRLVDAADPAQAVVVLVPVDPAEGAPPVQVAFPDPNFRFEFDNLRPGRYRIAARPALEATAGSVSRTAGMVEMEVPGGTPTDVDLPFPHWRKNDPEKGGK